MITTTRRLFCLMAASLAAIPQVRAQAPEKQEVLTAMRKAAEFFRTKVAVHGGYVYQCSKDLTRRWGEGKATPEQIWVQEPGTPAVGMAYLRAHAATGDKFYLDAARETAEALLYGQLESGGWTHSIDFSPDKTNAARYRNGKGREKGKNQSSLDDGVTQLALRFLMQTDKALGFKDAKLHEAVEFARAALLKAQFENGGFPQGWVGPVEKWPGVKAQFPDYDWKTENRIKNYWELPTLNDDLATDIILTLTDGWDIYKDEGCKRAIARLGDFLILAQMPEPQPGWAQQYDKLMRPAWARKFEPPAVVGSESQDAIRALLEIHRLTGDAKYLEPIPRALAWLKRSLLPDGRLARFYELRTNKPLYMTKEYALTYDDSDVPTHYGFKGKSRVADLEEELDNIKAGRIVDEGSMPAPARVREIIAALDSEGRWLTPPAGKVKGEPGELFISSEVFIKNLGALSDWMEVQTK